MRRSSEDGNVVSERSEQLEELQRLILVAFHTAAQQQKPEWYLMQGCVLKNRLLYQTGRSFDESDYGFSRFSDLVERLERLLSVDHSKTPYTVELREPFRSEIAPGDVTDPPERLQRIRSDLWDAIVDYSSNRDWVWVQSRELALDAQSADAAEATLLMPTLTESDFQGWRTKFAETFSKQVSDAESEMLEEWTRAGLGTDALPRRLRGPWNGWMKRQVLERLRAFFEEHRIEPPSDLLVSQDTQRTSVELRVYVSNCIALMNDDELRELRIPADVAMRAHR